MGGRDFGEMDHQGVAVNILVFVFGLLVASEVPSLERLTSMVDANGDWHVGARGESGYYLWRMEGRRRKRMM